jgi:hypothetical protein
MEPVANTTLAKIGSPVVGGIGASGCALPVYVNCRGPNGPGATCVPPMTLRRTYSTKLLRSASPGPVP